MVSKLGLYALVALGIIGCWRLKGNPWQGLEKEAFVRVVNHLDNACDVLVSTKEGESRFLGLVSPWDSVEYRIPFADQRVIVAACGVPVVLNVNKPTLHRLTVRRREGE